MSDQPVVEKRQIKAHPHLLLDVMQRQAGSLAKAILEGVMNSVDAGSDTCDVTVAPDVVTISDNGRGFRNRREIDEWFETFGTPHKESEKKVYGAFRMGRGQIFSFGHNSWASGEFRMVVDIKERGFDYDLVSKAEPHNGCHIKVKLYKKLLPSEMAETLRDVEKMAKYAQLKLTLNGKVVSIDPATEKWDFVTDEAYVRFRDSAPSLAVYNLGVWVRDEEAYKFGCGGVVIGRKQLKLNYARNEVMSDCPVWRKVKSLVNSKSTERNTKKSVLTEDERQRLADQIVSGEVEPDVASELRVLTDVTGRHLTPVQLQRSRFSDTLIVAKRGDMLGDKLMQSGICFVLAQETLDRFGVSGLKELVRILNNNAGICYNPTIRTYADLTKGMDTRCVVMEPKQWTPKEKAMVMAFDLASDTIRYHLARENDGHQAPPSRRTVIGESKTALAWTDGRSYIAFSRSFIAGLRFSSTGIFKLFQVGAHEFCHDAPDSDTHVHTPEFYRQYHDLSDPVAEAAGWTLRRLPSILEKVGVRASTMILASQDSQEKLARKVEEHGKFFGGGDEEEVAAMGTPVAPTAVPAAAPTAKPMEAVQKVVEKAAAKAVATGKPVVTAVQAVGPNPYRASSSYGILFAVGSQRDWTRDELLAEAARLTGKTVEVLGMALNVLMNPNHKSNGGKSRAVKDPTGKVRLVKVEAAAA